MKVYLRDSKSNGDKETRERESEKSLYLDLMGRSVKIEITSKTLFILTHSSSSSSSI